MLRLSLRNKLDSSDKVHCFPELCKQSKVPLLSLHHYVNNPKKSNRPLKRTLENAKIQLMKGFPSNPFSVITGTGVYSRGMLWRFSSKKNNTVLKNRGAAIWKVRKFQPQVVVDIFRKLEDGIVPRMTPRQLDKKMKNVVYPCGGGWSGCNTCWGLPKHWKTSGFCDGCRVLATPNVSSPKKKI